MGQYWQIIAPHLRETLGGWGKLGEFFTGDSPSCLDFLLAVPVLPSDSHPDKDTPKQASLWEDRLGAVRSKSSGSPTAHSSFLDLPTDVHHLIFQSDELEFLDLVSLSLVGPYFWRIGMKYVEALLRKTLFPWSGVAIICVGDYAEDFPEGLFTEDEVEELDLDEQEPSLYNLDCRKRSTEPAYSYWFWNRKLYTLLRCAEDLPEPDRSQARVMLELQKEQLYPEDRPWVLRNLTTREYVRAEAIALDPDDICGPEIEHRGFGHAILSRICRSSDPSIAMCYEGDIHRGVWAGHAFDIVPLSTLEKSMQKEEWKDASEEVAQLLAEIWAAEGH